MTANAQTAQRVQCEAQARLGQCSRTASVPKSDPRWCRLHDPEAPPKPRPQAVPATPARPTTIKLMSEHCPHAVTLYEDGAPQDRRVFAVGTAAHDCLDAIGRAGGKSPEQVAAYVCQRLMSEGRAGVDAEPPLPEREVFEGRDLAIRYAREAGLPTGQALFEVGFGFDNDLWAPAEYESAKWLRCRLDVVEPVVYEDEETSCEGLCARDYKSAWSADEGLLDSIQMRVQAVALWKRWRDLGLSGPGGPAFIRIEVACLRTLAHHRRDIFLDDDGIATLTQWAEDIRRFVLAHGHTPRKATPGVRCVSCPYVLACEHAARTVWAEHDRPADAETVARQYAAATAWTAGLQAYAREAAGRGSVPCDGGEVGFRALAKREPVDRAPVLLWERWTQGQQVDEATDGMVRGFLAAMGTTGGGINAVAKALYPERSAKSERDEFAAGFLGEKIERRFGVWPVARDGDDE